MLRFEKSVSLKLESLGDELYITKKFYTAIPNFHSRWNAIYVPTLEAFLRIGRFAALAIETIILVACNILGCLFSSDYSLRDAAVCAERAAQLLVILPVTILFCPLQIALQTLYILKNPETTTLWPC